MNVRAGLLAAETDVIDLEALQRAFVEVLPDPSIAEQRVIFGTSGHRGTAFNGSFNEAHIRAICTAIAQYRAAQGISGPLFLGADTHPLSPLAEQVARDTLLKQGVHVVTAAGTGDELYVPTPALSHAILMHNRGRASDDPLLADGIIVTPSHNPPQDGGIKYNPAHGGPADTDATGWIAQQANQLLETWAADALEVGTPALPDTSTTSASSLLSPATAAVAVDRYGTAADTGEIASLGSESHYDFLGEYVDALGEVIDLAAIKQAGVRIGAHPLGGASTAYWAAIRDKYELNLTVLGPGVDPTFRFMHLDWDGKIRMDPSSPHAMATALVFQQEFDLVTGNDADADRHGIITRDAGLMNPNHFLAVAIDYLLQHRPDWPATASIGKTLVSSAMIDRVIAAHGREMLEVPVGFKWFVPGLASAEVVFGGEESAGASFQRFDGTAWSTDKDGIILALLAAEIQAVTGQSPSERYEALVAQFGEPAYARVDAPATGAQKIALSKLSADAVTDIELAGDPITEIVTTASGNGAAIGGLKVQTAHAWFAARPSGTEDVMKVYAESFRGTEHLALVQQAAQALVARAVG